MAVVMKITMVWNVIPCSLIDGYHDSEELATSIFSFENSSSLKMEAVGSTKMLVCIYQTTL
jgi:hypothetical protein